MTHDKYKTAKAVKACLQSLYGDTIDANLTMAAHLIQVTIEELDDTINAQPEKVIIPNAGYNRFGLPH